MRRNHPEPQPIKALLATRRTPVTSLARSIRTSRHHLGRVFNGYEEGSPDLRARLASVLQVDEATLFRPHREAAARFPGANVLAVDLAGPSRDGNE
jgi:hypothetical protein